MYVFGPHITSRAERDFYRAIPAVTCTLGFCRRRLLRQAASASLHRLNEPRFEVRLFTCVLLTGEGILVVVCVDVDTEMSRGLRRIGSYGGGTKK